MLPFTLKICSVEIFTRATPSSYLVTSYYCSKFDKKALQQYYTFNFMNNTLTTYFPTTLHAPSPQLMMWCIVFYSSQDANWAFKVVPLLLWGGWFILGICWNTTTLLVSSAVWLADCLFQTMVCHYDLVSMIGKVSSHNCWLHLLYHDCKQYDSYKACLLYQ